MMKSIIKIICWVVSAIGLALSIAFYLGDNIEAAMIGIYIMGGGCLVFSIVTSIKIKGD